MNFFIFHYYRFYIYQILYIDIESIIHIIESFFIRILLFIYVILKKKENKSYIYNKKNFDLKKKAKIQLILFIKEQNFGYA